MELYRKVRLACRDGMSERAAARHFGVSGLVVLLFEQLRLSDSFACVRIGHVGEARPLSIEQLFD